MTNLEQKLKDIADVCFSSMPPMDELMQFINMACKVLDKDADEWYEKALWGEKK